VTRWSSPRELGGLVGLVLLESLWLHALVLVITSLGPSPLRLGYLTTAAPQLSCALLARASLQLPLRIPVQRLLLLAAAMALLVLWLRWVIAPDALVSLEMWGSLITRPWHHGIALGGPSLAIAWLIGLYTCVRGLLAGLAAQTGALVTHWFMIGAIALLTLFLVLAISGLPESQLPIARLQALTGGYFVCGMLVVGLAQRRSLYARERLRPPPSLAFALAMGLPASLVAASAVLLVGGRRVLRWAMERSLQLAEWSNDMLWLLARTLGRTVHVLLSWLGQLGGDRTARSRGLAVDSTAPVPELWGCQGRTWNAPEWNALPVFLLVAALVLFTMVLGVLLRARSRVLAADAVDESESLWSWALMKQQGWAALQRLLLGWRTQSKRLLRSDAISGERPSDTGLRDIRQVYRALLRWAATHGHPRARATTTLELAESLAADRSLAGADVAAITRCYNDARYGEQAIAEPELEHAREQLRALQDATRSPSGR